MSYILPVTPGAGATSGGSGTCAPVVNVSQVNNCAPGDGAGTGGGDTKDPSAYTAEDGTLEYAFDVTSVENISEGVYHVTTTPSFPVDGAGKVQCEISVTPKGELADPLETAFADFKVHSTVTFSPKDILIYFNEELQELYFPDPDYSTVFSVTHDRLVIFNPTLRSWVYIDFDTETFDRYELNKGTALQFDPINQVCYSMLTDGSSHNGTLIHNMVGRFKVHDTWNGTSHGQSFNHYVLAINPNNNTCLIIGDSHSLRWHNTVGGVPQYAAVATGTAAAGYDTPGVTPVVDINDNYWIYKNLGGSSQSWVRTFLSSGAIGTEDISISTDTYASGPTPTRINPTTNCFYYMSGTYDYLIKFDCTAKTATRVNASAYPALSSGTRHTTLRNITSLSWSSDYSKLIAVRGGSGSSPEDILIVDPVDGLVDSGIIIPDLYTRNFNSSNMAVAPGKAWLIGSEVVQEASFSGGEDFGLIAAKPVTYDATWLSANKCQVEFRSSITGARQNTAFHIDFHSAGTAAGGGGGGGTVTGEEEHQHVLSFAFGDASPELIGEIPANKQILSVTIFITAVFNGTGAALSIGTLGTPEDIMATSENAPTVLGAYEIYSQKSYGVPTSLYLHITPGSGASAGTGVAVVEYQP